VALTDLAMMSGHVESNDALLAGPQRFAAVLQRPVELEELFRVLVEVCVGTLRTAAERPDSPQTTTAASAALCCACAGRLKRFVCF